MPAIRTEELAKRYMIGKKAKQRELWALRGVSFEIQPGTLLGVIGPNGAGKTTLLKVLSRVTPPTSGRAFIRGRVVSLLEVGAAFQPELSARENIFLNAALFGIPRPEVLKRMDAIADFAEIHDRLDQPVKAFSSGMYLRLAFSVAINMEPDVLLADEVLAVGDAVFQERCLQRVEMDGKRGLTVMFVSHDMAAVRRLCSRTLWLNDGQVVDDGETEEVTTRYEETAWVHTMDLEHADGAAAGREGNEFGRLLDVTLTGRDGAEVGAVRTTDEVAVRVRFQTAVPALDARPGILLRTGGIPAFRSAPAGDEHLAEPGIYEAHVAIPPHLLADHVYSVKVGVRLRCRDEARSVARENALSFRVYDTEEQPDPLWTGPTVGTVQPRLTWTTTQMLVTPQEREL